MLSECVCIYVCMYVCMCVTISCMVGRMFPVDIFYTKAPEADCKRPVQHLLIDFIYLIHLHTLIHTYRRSGCRGGVHLADPHHPAATRGHSCLSHGTGGDRDLCGGAESQDQGTGLQD